MKKIGGFTSRVRCGGFTLLELLVSVGIIALISTIRVVSFTTAQKKSRDAKRVTHLSDIQNAFEQYFSICGYQYPVTAGGTSFLTSGNTLTSCSSSDVLITYPNDPLVTGGYQCINCTVSSYTVCPPDVGGGAYLETATSSCNTTNTSCCVKNQQ